jgi:hypothetical protein
MLLLAVLAAVNPVESDSVLTVPGFWSITLKLVALVYYL